MQLLDTNVIQILHYWSTKNWRFEEWFNNTLKRKLLLMVLLFKVLLNQYAVVVQHLTDIVSSHYMKYASNIKAIAKGFLLELTTYEAMHFFMHFMIIPHYIQMLQNTWKVLQSILCNLKIA